MKKLTTLFIPYILLISACKQKNEYSNVAEEAKHYGGFDYGSYWVYQNDSSLLIDSLYVLDFTYNTLEEGGSADHVHRFITTLNVLVGTMDTSATFRYGMKLDDNSCYYGINNKGGELRLGGYANSTGLTPFNEGVQFKYFTQMSVNGKVYDNVYEITDTAHNSVNAAVKVVTGTLYLVRDIGLIKGSILYDDGSGDSWSLLRHNAIVTKR